MTSTKRRIIKIYQDDNGNCPFISWLESLDAVVRQRIKSRLARVTLGNLGEYKPLGDGVAELKFKFGSGYRVYFSEIDNVIVLLLSGGDKRRQSKDIKLAKAYLRDYLTGENDG